MHSSSPVRTPKLELAAEPSTGECWIPPKKDTPRLRAKKKPQQDGMRDTIMFKIKFQTCQRRSEEADKILCVLGLKERNSDPHKRLSQTRIYIIEKWGFFFFFWWLLSLITLTKHFIFFGYWYPAFPLEKINLPSSHMISGGLFITTLCKLYKEVRQRPNVGQLDSRLLIQSWEKQGQESLELSHFDGRHFLELRVLSAVLPGLWLPLFPPFISVNYMVSSQQIPFLLRPMDSFRFL